MALPVDQNAWHLITNTKGSPYKGPSGKADPALLDKVERRKGFVAVYVIGLTGVDGKETDEIRIGCAQRPSEIFKTAQQWNPREIIVHGVLWTPGKKWADLLKSAVETELKPYAIRGSWYELEPRMVINTIIVCGQQIKAEAFELFNDQSRYLKYETEIEESIKKRPMLHRQPEPVALPPPLPQFGGKVIQLTPRSR